MKYPKCPKCKHSGLLDVIDTVTRCGSCGHQWKASATVRAKIDTQNRESAARRKDKEKLRKNYYSRYDHKPMPTRNEDGWLSRVSVSGYVVEELNLEHLSVKEQIANRDALTDHHDGLIEVGFVDGVMNLQHTDYCFIIDNDDEKVLAKCDIDCPIVAAYHNSAYRVCPEQLAFGF